MAAPGRSGPACRSDLPCWRTAAGLPGSVRCLVSTAKADETEKRVCDPVSCRRGNAGLLAVPKGSAGRLLIENAALRRHSGPRSGDVLTTIRLLLRHPF